MIVRVRMTTMLIQRLYRVRLVGQLSEGRRTIAVQTAGQASCEIVTI